MLWSVSLERAQLTKGYVREPITRHFPYLMHKALDSLLVGHTRFIQTIGASKIHVWGFHEYVSQRLHQLCPILK